MTAEAQPGWEAESGETHREKKLHGESRGVKTAAARGPSMPVASTLGVEAPRWRSPASSAERREELMPFFRSSKECNPEEIQSNRLCYSLGCTGSSSSSRFKGSSLEGLGGEELERSEGLGFEGFGVQALQDLQLRRQTLDPNFAVKFISRLRDVKQQQHQTLTFFSPTLAASPTPGGPPASSFQKGGPPSP
ncbi:hypothetical protein Emag_006002 [Eimeria magna]